MHPTVWAQSLCVVLSKTSFQHTCGFIVLLHDISLVLLDFILEPNYKSSCIKYFSLPWWQWFSSKSLFFCLGMYGNNQLLPCYKCLSGPGFLKQTNKKFFQNFSVSSANKDSLFLHSKSVYLLFHFRVWLHCPEVTVSKAVMGDIVVLFLTSEGELQALHFESHTSCH